MRPVVTLDMASSAFSDLWPPVWYPWCVVQHSVLSGQCCTWLQVFTANSNTCSYGSFSGELESALHTSND